MMQDVPQIFEAVFQCTLEVGESFVAYYWQSICVFLEDHNCLGSQMLKLFDF